MRRIIDGKLYNTETATLIGSDGFSYPGDFHYWEETLYQKKNGQFFLVGEGGPLTRYREQTETNAWTDGKILNPLSLAEAQEWAEQHISVNKYIEVFGEVEE